MNFGRSKYDKQIKQLGIDPKTIIDIDEIRTYKKFLNVVITYEIEGIEYKKNFKAISLKKKDNDEDYR